MNDLNTPLFSIVHATNRPYGWQAVYSQYCRRAVGRIGRDFEYILAWDYGQDEDFAPVRENPDIHTVVNCNRPCYIDGANEGAVAAKGQIILMATDDMFPPKRWDDHLKNDIAWLYEDVAKGTVIWVNDGIFPHIMTMQIFTRQWYERYGYVFKPEYQSMMGDHDFTRRAVRDGVVIDVRDNPALQWDHHHHRNGKRAADSSDDLNQSASRYVQGWRQIMLDWPEDYWAGPTGPLQDLYLGARSAPGDIREHMDTLRDLAAGRRVLELGVRQGVSTVALLSGGPKELVSVDIDLSNLDPQVPAAAELAGIPFRLVCGNSADPGLPIGGDFDLIFIDTLHTAAHVRAELAVWAPRCTGLLVFHDTVTNGETGEDGGPGIMEPIAELMPRGWHPKKHYTNCNGLMILERIPEPLPVWGKSTATTLHPELL